MSETTETKVAVLVNTVDKHDRTLEKMLEIAETLKDLLYQHNTRIASFESMDIQTRLTSLERYKWILIGAIAISSFVASLFTGVLHMHVNIN